MRKTPLKIFALAAVLSFVGAVAAVARDSSDKASAKKAPKATAKTVLEEIAGYKGWTRVTGKPIQIDIAALAGG